MTELYSVNDSQLAVHLRIGGQFEIRDILSVKRGDPSAYHYPTGTDSLLSSSRETMQRGPCMGKQPCAATLPSSCAYSSLADRAASSTKTTIAFLNQSLSRNSSRLCCIGFDGGKPNYSPMHSLGRLVPVSRQGLQTQFTWTKNSLLG